MPATLSRASETQKLFHFDSGQRRIAGSNFLSFSYPKLHPPPAPAPALSVDSSRGGLCPAILRTDITDDPLY
jgi:hypothetical protein